MSKRIQYGNLDPYFGQTVRIYWNLHQQMYSIQAKVDGKWKVVRHSMGFVLDDVKPQVNATVRDRVRRTKRKEVHAYLVGTLRSLYADSAMEFMNADHITYNPHTDDGFVYKTELRPPTPQMLDTVIGTSVWTGDNKRTSLLKAHAYNFCLKN